MKHFFLSVLFAVCFSGVPAAQPERQQRTQNLDTLTPDQFRQLASRCAPYASYDTLIAVAGAESALYANAVSLNYPARAAQRAGYPHAELLLARQPKDRTEALAWMHWFFQHGYTVSVGLMQVNIENSRYFHVPSESLFEPCTNVAVGASILTDLYEKASRIHATKDAALLAAVSAYNSGSYLEGFRNGYVDRVLHHRVRTRTERQ